MQSELFWTLDDNVLAVRVPANHVVVLGSLEQGIELGEEGGLLLAVGIAIGVLWRRRRLVVGVVVAVVEVPVGFGVKVGKDKSRSLALSAG